MRTLSIFGGAVLALAAAGMVMAASPQATPVPTPAPTPAPVKAPAKLPATSGSTSPSTSTSGTSGSSAPAAAGSSATSAATASGKMWTAQIRPLDVTTGSASVSQKADGSGVITVTLKGLRPDARWTVDIESGTSTRLVDESRHEIAFRTGLGLDRVSSDTFRIHLTKAEMKRFLAERKASGAVVLVSDGHNRSAAVFAAG